MNNFGILTWEVDKPSKSVTYLDLTIEIDGNSFITRTYQKPYNLYQYISPNSPHPAGMIKGVIHTCGCNTIIKIAEYMIIGK